MKKSYVCMSIFAAFLLLCYGIVSASNSDKEISDKLNNAIQHIQSINFVDSNNNWRMAVMSSLENKVRIDTNNFVIASEADQAGAIDNTTTLSSVLWWTSNHIYDSTGSSIIGWSGNNLNSNYAVIIWWVNNKIQSGSDYSVIAGWSTNSIKWKISVIAWWKNNNITGDYSAIVGVNNTISGHYSVALWSWSNVNANNSFLWTDGESSESLSVDNVFAVVSKSWMVINTTEAHELAQLTIGGSLTVAWSGRATCSPDTIWSLRLVDKENNQKCLCSCNGESWDSVLWDGECVAKCLNEDGSSLIPVCGDTLTLTGDASHEYYIWSCKQWEVISGSFYMNTSGMNWTCQDRDWSIFNCLYQISCNWDLPKHAVVSPLFPKLNSETNWNYHYSRTGDVCSFVCETWFAYNGHNCVEVCNKTNNTCLNEPHYEKIAGYDSYTQTGSYTCSGNNDIVICPVDCWSQVWNGTSCRQRQADYCSWTHYNCLDEGILHSNNPKNLMEKHTRNCVNSLQQIIWDSCTENKKIHNVILTWAIVRVATGNTIGHTVSFKLSEKLPEDLIITLPWKVNVIPEKKWSSVFKIKSWALESEPQYFESDLISFETGITNPSRMSTENDYYTITVKKSENFVCYGEIPEWAKLNANKAPSLNMKYRYSTNSNDACSFTTCNNGYHLDTGSKVCCPWTNSNDPNTYAIFTGGKCRTADHWEWRFNQPQPSLTTTSWKEILGAFFTQSSPSYFTTNTTVSWNSSLSQILWNIAWRHSMNSFVTPYAITGNKITVTLSNFYTGWLPVMSWTQRPSYTLTVQTGNLTKDILNLTFTGNQPTVTRMYSSTWHTTKTFYGCIIARWDSVSGTSHKWTVSLTCPWTISATATPIYTKDCEAKTVPGWKISTYGYYFYHVSPIDHWKTLKVESVWAHKCTYTFSCNNWQLSSINKTNEQC